MEALPYFIFRNNFAKSCKKRDREAGLGVVFPPWLEAAPSRIAKRAVLEPIRASGSRRRGLPGEHVTKSGRKLSTVAR